MFATLVRDSANLSLVTQPSLGLSVFRLDPRTESDEQPALTLESLNELNRLLYGRISARNDIMLTQTTLNGIFCIRLAVGATRTTEVHIRAAYDIICKEAETAFEMWAQTRRPTPMPSRRRLILGSSGRLTLSLPQQLMPGIMPYTIVPASRALTT